MSYVALYRKWRPKTFTDVVGQHQVSDTLMRAIREDKVAHAYLFSGPRGTGKTSMAKIFGRAINCEHGPTDHPCNKCESCQQILRGQSMDVLEIDAASNRGIDEIRSLREQVNFMPVLGRKKMFIIDEAHMLTTEAWNALLKTIEEPPSHVIFVFATTEIEKLPVTIVSRCQRYTFRRITTQDIANHLMYVARESQIALDPAAAQLIAVHADGGLRDALSILDQCAGMAVDGVTTAIVEDMIGLVSKAWVIELLQAITRGDGAKVLLLVQQALQEGRDARQIIEALVQHLRALIVGKVMSDAEELMVYDTIKEAFSEQMNSLSMELINHYIMQLQRIQSDAKWVDNPRIIIEIGLLSLLGRIDKDGSTEERIGQLEQKVAQETEGVMNRLAKLEQGIVSGTTGIAPPTGDGMYGGYGDSPNNVFSADSMVSSTIPLAEMAHRDEMHPVPEGEPISGGGPVLGRVPVPGRVAPPKPMSSNMPIHGGGPAPGIVPPPKSGGSTRPKHKEISIAPPTIKGGQAIRGTHEYRTIHQNVIKWLHAHKMGMCATFYGKGEPIYIDESLVVVEFKVASVLGLLKQERQLKEAIQGYSSILGYPVHVEVVGANTEEALRYRKLVEQSAPKSEEDTSLTNQKGRGVNEVHISQQDRSVNEAPISQEARSMDEIHISQQDRNVDVTHVSQQGATNYAFDQGSTEGIPSMPSFSEDEIDIIDAPIVQDSELGMQTQRGPMLAHDLGKGVAATQGAGSRPTNAEGIIDDFLTVYEDPDAVLSSAPRKSSVDIQQLPKWDGPTEDELAEPLLREALDHLRREGHEIYVEEIDD